MAPSQRGRSSAANKLRVEHAAQPVDFAQVIIDQGTPKPTCQDPGTLRVHLPGGAWLLLDGDATQTTLAAQILKALQA